MSKIKNGGLDQYGAGPLEQQQFGTAGAGGVKLGLWLSCVLENGPMSISEIHRAQRVLNLVQARLVLQPRPTPAKPTNRLKSALIYNRFYTLLSAHRF